MAQEVRLFEIGEEVKIVGLKNQTKYNGLFGEIVGYKTSKQRYSVNVYVNSNKFVALSVKPANITQTRSNDLLEEAVRSDIMKGEIKIPINIESLKREIEAIGGIVECHNCKSKEKPRYSALNNPNNLQLECIDCLVFAAKKSRIKINHVTQFIDDRYMGSVEAFSTIHGYANAGIWVSDFN
eukprot:217390_1